MSKNYLKRPYLFWFYRKILSAYNDFLKERNLPLKKRLLMIKRRFHSIRKPIEQRGESTFCHKDLPSTDKLNKLTSYKKQLFYQQNRQNYIGKVNIFNGQDLKAINGLSPNLEIALLENCHIYGQTITISDEKKIYNPLLHNMNLRHEYKGLGVVSLNPSNNRLFELHHVSPTIGREDIIYIHLLDEYAHNYTHWSWEVMPKLIQVNKVISQDDSLQHRQFALLVDANVSEQFCEMIDLCISFQHHIVKVEKNHNIKCPQLIYCSPFFYSFDNLFLKVTPERDFFVDNYGLRLLRDAFLKNQTTVTPFRKIYLRRPPNGSRGLINHQEIDEFLSSQGFEIHQLDKMPFQEEIKIMHEAKVIIGPGGSAFINILFMQKDTHAISLCPNTDAMSFYIVHAPADISRVKLINIISENKVTTIHEKIEIDLKKIKIILKDKVV